MLLLRFVHDWSDEFDVYGIKLISEEKWERKKEFIRNVQDYPYEFGFGTNEEIVFEEPKDLINSIDVDEITDEEAKVLIKYRLEDFGHFPI